MRKAGYHPGLATGVIAAGGLYALENNIERLQEDHANAEKLARGLRELKLDVQVNTNMALAKVPPEKVAELINLATIVVMPSHREGLPTVVLEASAMSLPVVATAIPACIDAGVWSVFLSARQVAVAG